MKKDSFSIKKAFNLSNSPNTMLRSSLLRSAFSWKKVVKKWRKNILKKSENLKFLFQFFWLSVFHSQFRFCLQRFGGSSPAGLDRR
jgi:hypothetical protein